MQSPPVVSLARIDRFCDPAGRLRYFVAVLSDDQTAAVGQMTVMHAVRLAEAI